MENSDQAKSSPSLNPIVAFIFCFIIFVFSINQIINMAMPITIVSQEELENEKYFALANTLIQSPSQLDYKKFDTLFSKSFSAHPDYQVKFNIEPQIEEQSANEQNSIIRSKLNEWMLQQLQNQRKQKVNATPESLIYKTGFWIYGFFIWSATIVGGRILTVVTNEIIYKYWKIR